MKEIKNYENYIVSKDGRIYNKITSKKIKPSPDTRGYLQVKIYKNGKYLIVLLSYIVTL